MSVRCTALRIANIPCDSICDLPEIAPLRPFRFAVGGVGSDNSNRFVYCAFLDDAM
jgi:hypothetical protein